MLSRLWKERGWTLSRNGTVEKGATVEAPDMEVGGGHAPDVVEKPEVGGLGPEADGTMLELRFDVVVTVPGSCV